MKQYSILCVCVCVCVWRWLVAKLCPTLCDPMACGLASPSAHGDFPGKNAGVGCYSLLQEIFPTQGSNPGLLHLLQIFYCLSHQGSPKYPKTSYNTSSHSQSWSNISVIVEEPESLF